MLSRATRSAAAFTPWLVLLLLLAMRLLWLGAYPLDSDEPQHAHVAWSLAQGELLYRDVFDNHGPLFATLYAPLFRGLGERADILWWLRLAVVPWYFLALIATWRIGRRLYRPAVADAAVLLVALMQIFFVKMGEFRTDDLWTALWLCALAVAIHAGCRVRRWLLAGLCVGAALSISQKTLPLLATAVLAAGPIWMASGNRVTRRVLVRLLAFVAGGLLVPSGFLLYLAWQHSLAPAWYDLVAYGTSPMGGPSHAWRQAAYLLLAVLLLIAATLRLRRQTTANNALWRAFLALHGLLYALLIWVAWPLSTPQDFLPVIPTLLLALTGLGAARLEADRSGRGAATLAVLLAFELALLVAHAPPWRDALAGERTRLATVLHCTDAADTVMDAKSGAIFHARPYYLVLESLALRRLKHGLMLDTIADSLIAHRTMVVIPDRLPAAARMFVERNYLPGTAGVFVAGMDVPVSSGLRQFTITLPGDYVVSDGRRPVPASVDGGHSAEQWDLGKGTHTLATADGRPLVLTWSKAWQRGWRPAS